MNIKRLGLVCAVLLLSQLLLVACEKQKEGEKEKDKAGKEKPADDGNQKAAKKPAASGQNEKGQKQKGGKASPKGKFSTKEKAECTWAVSEADSVSLQVDCTQQGGFSFSFGFSCVFAGNPSACPQYAVNPKSYWKQITRALKKQKDICQDPKAVLKAKDCKRGPHFSFLSSTLLEAAPTKVAKKSHRGKKGPENPEPTSASPAAPTKGGKKSHHGKKGPKNPEPTSASPVASQSSTECAEDADSVDQKKVAEEYCGDTWGSFCTFFIAMLQNKKC